MQNAKNKNQNPGTRRDEEAKHKATNKQKTNMQKSKTRLHTGMPDI